MTDMLTIDGSLGEGGGQILRSSLSLSMITGTPFRIDNIRAGRRKPGLMRQHLTAVQAAERISEASVDGAELGSTKLVFEPGDVRAGRYDFAVGTAGSTMLVLQTILPPLLVCDGPSEVAVEGGTHNPKAPIFEFVERAFLPQLEALGAKLDLELDQHGFYPAGGGRVRATIERGFDRNASLELVERGEVDSVRAASLLAHLPEHIAEREFEALAEALDVPVDETHIVAIDESRSPGNALVVELDCARITEVVSGIGQKGVRAEDVAERCAKAVNGYVASGAPIGPFLADQLLLPIAITSGGVIRISECTTHTETQIELISRFVEVGFERSDDDSSTVIQVEK